MIYIDHVNPGSAVLEVSLAQATFSQSLPGPVTGFIVHFIVCFIKTGRVHAIGWGYGIRR